MITIRLFQNTFLLTFPCFEATASAPQLLSQILLPELRLYNITNMQQENVSHTWIRKRSDRVWIQLQRQQNKISAYNNTGPDRLVATNARARATLHSIQNSKHSHTVSNPKTATQNQQATIFRPDYGFGDNVSTATSTNSSIVPQTLDAITSNLQLQSIVEIHNGSFAHLFFDALKT